MTVLGRHRRIAAQVAAVAAAALLVASCSTVSGIVRTQRALSRAGFREASIRLDANTDTTVLKVAYRTKATDVAALTDEYADAARIVWQKAPLRFDAVEVDAIDAPGSCVGDCVNRFDRQALAEQNGPRDPNLDKDIENELLGIGLVVLAVIAIAVILLIWLLMRSRRKARQAQPWGYLPGQAPPGYAPPAYTPPGWGPGPGAPPPGWSPGPGAPPQGWSPGPGAPPPGWSPGPGAPPQGWPGGPGVPPTAPTPHQPAPGFAPPPPGYVAPQQPQPSAEPPPVEAPPEPPPMPTHDIWERPPS